MTTKTRTPEREEFLGDLLVTAVENCGYGEFDVVDYHVPDGEPREWYAIVQFYGETEQRRVTIDTMATGLRVIRSARRSTMDNGDVVLVNAATGERLYFGGESRVELLSSDRTNGDDGDYDVIGALAVLECAVYGRVVNA